VRNVPKFLIVTENNLYFGIRTKKYDFKKLFEKIMTIKKKSGDFSEIVGVWKWEKKAYVPLPRDEYMEFIDGEKALNTQNL
jgi:hypothetical protein